MKKCLRCGLEYDDTFEQCPFCCFIGTAEVAQDETDVPDGGETGEKNKKHVLAVSKDETAQLL